MMWATVLRPLLGLTLLVMGSDCFVSSAAVLAKAFGVSEFVISLHVGVRHFTTKLIPAVALGITPTRRKYSQALMMQRTPEPKKHP